MQDSGSEVERWEPIPGYSGFEASTEAHVRKIGDGRILKVGKGAGWVRQVMLRNYGARCLHLLVGLTFLGPCPAGEKVQFRDGNQQNCRRANLFYGPPSHRHSAMTGKGGSKKIWYQTFTERIWRDLLPETEKIALSLKGGSTYEDSPESEGRSPKSKE